MPHKEPIRCRLFIPAADGYREWPELTEPVRMNVSGKSTERMGTALNEFFSRDHAAYQKVCSA